MSSLRNSVKRRTHKERHQPKSRQKLGLLEHHKDYVLRARDYHSKEDRLKVLREKAAFRNPDEFYFGMVNSKTKDGVHQVTREHDTPVGETLKLMHTKDSNYVTARATQELKKVQRLQKNLGFISSKVPNKHVICFDDDEEVKTFDAAKYFDTAPELVDRKFNRPRKEALEKSVIIQTSIKRMNQRIETVRAKRYKELSARMERLEGMDTVMEDIALKKNLTTKGERRQVKRKDGDKPAVYKWKKERKR